MNIPSNGAGCYKTELFDHPSGPAVHEAFQRRELLLTPLKFDNLTELQGLLLQLLHEHPLVCKGYMCSPQ